MIAPAASRKHRGWRAIGLRAGGVVLLGGAGAAGLWWSVSGEADGARQYVAVISTVALLIAQFFIGHALVMKALANRTTVCSVARSVIREAMAMKVGEVLLVMLCLVIAAAPFVIGEGDKLQYRIQQFLTYSLAAVFALMSLLTIFLACSTLTSEIEGRQIFTVMTKPVHRGRYLLGKWLGLTLLNGLLLLVGGGAIYGFAVGYLQRQPAMDALDRAAIGSQVLTARVAAKPQPPADLAASIEKQVRERVESLKQNQGELYIESQGGEAQVLQEYRNQALTEWRSLGPWQGGRDQSMFVFDQMHQARERAIAQLQARVQEAIAGLEAEVRERMSRDAEFDAYVRSEAEQSVRAGGYDGQYVQLAYFLRATGETPDSETRIRFGANGRWLGDAMQVPTRIRQTLLIPAELIDEEGRLEVLARNYNPQASITFSEKDGLELLYRVDDFLPNYVRGLMMLWLKLAFIAALGLSAATFVGFPVAVLLSLLVVVGASFSGFILESVQGYGSSGTEQQLKVVKTIIQWIALLFTQPLEQYGQYKPIQNLSEGLYISWRAVGTCALWIGGVWTGVAGLIGLWIFKGRELARVQV